jgi:DHA1 family bicyclomycin/chloramphenicol resistance-like MFS transporter
MASAPSRRLIVLLGALIAFAPLSVDMYLPSFPTLQREFAAADGSVQLTLAAYFIGMALGQALYGPIADHFGRKPPLYAGCLLYVVASFACSLAGSIESLIAWRFVQAIGGCAGMVISQAVVRDLFDLKNSARVLSRMMLVMGVAPILGPLLGGQILLWASWRMIFVLLGLFGIACLLVVVTALPETKPGVSGGPIGIGRALRTYAALACDRRFVGFTLCSAFSSMGMFAYIAGSPFVLIELYHVPAQAFGWIFGSGAIGIISAAQINHRLLASHRPIDLLRMALVGMLGCGLVLLLMTTTNWLGLAGVVLPLVGFVAMVGFVNPNSTAGAMAEQGHRAGSASALMGSVRFAAATVAGALVGVMHDGTALPMVAIMLAGVGGALVVYRTLIGKA